MAADQLISLNTLRERLLLVDQFVISQKIQLILN